MVTLGSEIKKAMRKKKLTQQQLADKIGVARSSISYYMSDKAEPPYGTVINLCKILDIDFNSITGMKTYSVNKHDFELINSINQLPEKEYLVLLEIIRTFTDNYNKE